MTHMAPDARATEAGPPPPPPRSFSRYRTLRGKSVSSPSSSRDNKSDKNNKDIKTSTKTLDDAGAGSGCGETQSSSAGAPDQVSSDSRSRSKSLSSFRLSLKAQQQALSVPALPTRVLSPKPVSIAAQSSLRFLESWRLLAGSSKPANGGAATGRDGGSSAAAGPTHQRDGPHSSQEPIQEPIREPDQEPGQIPVQVPVQVPVQDQQDRDHDRDQHKDQDQDQDQVQTSLTLQQTPANENHPQAEETKGKLDVNADTKGCDDKPLLAKPPPPAAKRHPPPPQQQQQQQQRNVDCDGHVDKVADEVARLEAETDRILAEQKKLDLARLQAQLVTLTPSPKPRRQILDKLSFFSRNRRSSVLSIQPGTPSTVVSAVLSPTFSQYSRESSLEDPPSPPLSTGKMKFIEQGGKGIVPQTDAPLSAINGGERRVIVRCLSSTINLPVTADTTPMDILKATAETTRHQLTPASSVIIECYLLLGLERRLRRYERVRDVMNSWDKDQQNSLLVMSRDGSQTDEDLDIESVPRTDEPPSGFSLQMYHSAKPGKWNKRWVTLLDNGQMYAAKSAKNKPSDKESIVLCHLTDFDVYTPKESEMRRHLKPPKQFCYAIKSQQKTVVFHNGENFVHFFSIEDAQEAEHFCKKVHGWRSWYLASRLVDLEKRSKPPQLVLDAKGGGTSGPKRTVNRSSASAPSSTVAGEEESEEAQEGADEPLMNVDDFRISKIVLDDATIQKSLSRAKTSARRPNASKKVSSGAVPEIPNTVDEEEPEFSAGGLLGDEYKKRKQAEVASSTKTSSSSSDGPFTETPSLLNGGICSSSSSSSDAKKQPDNKPESPSWFPSAAEHSARVRDQQVVHVQQQQQQRQRRPMSSGGVVRRERHPAPLLSFAADFPEPPRFHKGPNPGIKHAPGQPLINFASGGTLREPRDCAPKRNVSRRGMPAGNDLAPPPPPPPCPQRLRSKSSASHPQRRYNGNEGHQKNGPLLHMRRSQHGEPPSHPHPRGPPLEPLVNRAR
ncbi:uncharacterized protein UV8b_06925 [Ustilaginoidea virens]|uniref:PH domain-containing protein n=1 Tax=Ustilaginoidea virens TaxID=1159556 RepID=A0A8E5HW34_USTVR|nr:uncharacterized protein UV8b_06925 [Ustilaginoidea virens]QUC22684.1 hypothetical protein UV8b_06925 [Ustilaginoidea virens]